MRLKRATLGDLSNGAIVLVGDRWGVICQSNRASYQKQHYVVDFWDGGLERVRRSTVVQVQTR